MGTHSPNKTARQVWANGRMAALGLAKRNGAKLTTFQNCNAVLDDDGRLLSSKLNCQMPIGQSKTEGQAVTEKVKAMPKQWSSM